MSIRDLAAFASVFCALGAQAQDEPLPDEVARKIAGAVDGYITAMGCQHAEVTVKDIAALAPRATEAATTDYAVIWDGDIGCQGHAGSVSSNIAVVAPGAGGTFVVVAARSSPHVAFPLPLAYEHQIVGHTPDAFTLEGVFLGSADALCCPSDRRRYTLARAEHGDWKIVSLRELESKR